MKNIFYVIIFLSLVPVFLLFVANPLLVENSLLLLNASNSGGHASSQGMSSSSKGSSSGSGGISGAPIEIDIYITVPSVDATFNNAGIMRLDWETRETISVVDVKVLSIKNLIQFDNVPISVKTDKVFFTEGFSSGKFSYSIRDDIPYGVHQIPLVVTVNDGYRNYEARTFLTIDNTGFFFILENFRGIFGTPSTIFESV